MGLGLGGMGRGNGGREGWEERKKGGRNGERGKMEGKKGGMEKKDEEEGRKKGKKGRAGIPSLCHKDLVHTLLLEQLNNFRAQHGGGDSDGSGHLQTADGMIPPPTVRQRGPGDQTFKQSNGEFYTYLVMNISIAKIKLFIFPICKYSLLTHTSTKAVTKLHGSN